VAKLWGIGFDLNEKLGRGMICEEGIERCGLFDAGTAGADRAKKSKKLPRILRWESIIRMGYDIGARTAVQLKANGHPARASRWFAIADAGNPAEIRKPNSNWNRATLHVRSSGECPSLRACAESAFANDSFGVDGSITGMRAEDRVESVNHLLI
jgi:hypothetical protein